MEKWAQGHNAGGGQAGVVPAPDSQADLFLCPSPCTRLWSMHESCRKPQWISVRQTVLDIWKHSWGHARVLSLNQKTGSEARKHKLGTQVLQCLPPKKILTPKPRPNSGFLVLDTIWQQDKLTWFAMLCSGCLINGGNTRLNHLTHVRLFDDHSNSLEQVYLSTFYRWDIGAQYSSLSECQRDLRVVYFGSLLRTVHFWLLIEWLLFCNPRVP